MRAGQPGRQGCAEAAFRPTGPANFPQSTLREAKQGAGVPHLATGWVFPVRSDINGCGRPSWALRPPGDRC